MPLPMLQELLSEPSDRIDKEYTCSIFKCKNIIFGPFYIEKNIKIRNSWALKLIWIKTFLLDIGNKFPTLGSLNIQLMMTKNGPVPFEFNARSFGTTAVRSHFKV